MVGDAGEAGAQSEQALRRFRDEHRAARQATGALDGHGHGRGESHALNRCGPPFAGPICLMSMSLMGEGGRAEEKREGQSEDREGGERPARAHEHDDGEPEQKPAGGRTDRTLMGEMTAEMGEPGRRLGLDRHRCRLRLGQVQIEGQHVRHTVGRHGREQVVSSTTGEPGGRDLVDAVADGPRLGRAVRRLDLDLGAVHGLVAAEPIEIESYPVAGRHRHEFEGGRGRFGPRGGLCRQSRHLVTVAVTLMGQGGTARCRCGGEHERDSQRPKRRRETDGHGERILRRMSNDITRHGAYRMGIGRQARVRGGSICASGTMPDRRGPSRAGAQACAAAGGRAGTGDGASPVAQQDDGAWPQTPPAAQAGQAQSIRDCPITGIASARTTDIRAARRTSDPAIARSGAEAATGCA